MVKNLIILYIEDIGQLIGSTEDIFGKTHEFKKSYEINKFNTKVRKFLCLQ